MFDLSPSRETGIAAAGAAPPVAAATAVVTGMTLQDWVLVLTLVYLVLQIGFLLFKWWREWRRAKIA